MVEAELRYSMRNDFPDRLHMFSWEVGEGPYRRTLHHHHIRDFFEFLGSGFPVKVCLELASVPLSSFKMWCNKGRAGEPKYVDFYNAYLYAKRMGQLPIIQNIINVGKTDARIGLQYMAVADPENFAKKKDDSKSKGGRSAVEPTRVVHLSEGMEEP